MRYYVNVNAQNNGDHEVHVPGCSYFPKSEHARFLGDFTNCKEAVIAAKKYFTQVNGCYYCSNACHTQ